MVTTMGLFHSNFSPAKENFSRSPEGVWTNRPASPTQGEARSGPQRHNRFRLAGTESLTAGTEKSLSLTKFYTLKDKPGTILACKLTPWFCCMTIPKIRQSNGSQTLNLQTTINLFHCYYASLYRESGTLSLGTLDNFVKDLPPNPLPSLLAPH